MNKTISLSKVQAAKLREYCEAEGITHSEAIRRGLALLLAQNGQGADKG